jgi:RNA 2',3'-cyclic 3'-phosphodiesterase
MHRLFVAIRPPGPLRTRLLDLTGGVPGARWQDDEQLHLTLRFVGEVDGRTADDVADALAGVRAKPLEIALAGAGCFDRRGSPDTLWIGVSPAEPLAALHRKIDHALVRTGLPPEGRAYRPHVTIARFGRGAPPLGDALARLAGVRSDPHPVTDFRLYESHLDHDGARYEEVARYALSGG